MNPGTECVHFFLKGCLEAGFLSDHDELVESKEDDNCDSNTMIKQGIPPLTSKGLGACGKKNAGKKARVNQEARSKLPPTIPKFRQIQTRSCSQKIKGRHASKTSVHIADADGKRVVSSLVCECKSIIFCP